MKIGIIGWYGTETLGDRAILIGIYSMLNRLGKDIEIVIGSLYPFFSERTTKEDKDVVSSFEHIRDVKVVDVKDKQKRDEMISTCSMILIGGGPLLEIREVDMFIEIFKHAKRKQCITAIIGCGIGRITKIYYKKKIVKLFELSDIRIVRDKASENLLNEFAGEKVERVKVLPDPAILAALEYHKGDVEKKKHDAKILAVNFRKYDNMFQHDIRYDELDFATFIRMASDVYDRIELVPMHNFKIGGDDREYLFRIQMLCNRENVVVLQAPMSVKQLFDVYETADACIGMRYHSIVFQTLLNGNNIVLDYTDGKLGKIYGFIEKVDKNHFYENRICELQNQNEEKTGTFLEYLKVLQGEKHFLYDRKKLLQEFDYYIKIIRDTLNI